MGNTQALRKKILADPVVELIARAAVASEEDIARVKDLHAQYQVVKKSIKVFKVEKGGLSRQIGKKKKEGIDITETLRAVEVVSKKIDSENNVFKALEQKLLDFFPSEEPSFGAGNKASNLPKLHSQYHSNDTEYTQYNLSELGNDTSNWDAFVKKTPGASVYHLSRWREIIKSCFGHQSIYLYAENDSGEILGVLPLVRLKSILFGDFLVSIPYFNYGGALAVCESIEIALMRRAAVIADELSIEHVEFRDDVQRPDWPVKTDKVAMLLQLPATEAELLHQLGSKLRAQIKRAEKENLQTEVGRINLLDDFYSVFSKHMRDLGTPVYGKDFFSEILKSFPDDAKIIVLRHRSKPVATGFLLGHGSVLEIPWASTLGEVNKLNANMLLYWEVLRFAMSNRYQHFDFGRSSKDSGTYRFKKQWGAIEKPLFWHYHLRGGESLPMINPSNPKFALLISVWKRLPVAVTKLIGPPIVKNLP